MESVARRVGSAASVWLYVTATALAAPADDLRTTARDTSAALGELQAAYIRLVARDAAGQRDGFFNATILDQREQPLIEVLLHIRAGRCLWGSAWSVGPSAWSHRLEATDLEGVGAGDSLGLKGEMVLWSGEPWTLSDRQEDRRAVLTLSVRSQGGGQVNPFTATPHRVLRFARAGTVRGTRLDAKTAGLPHQRELDLTELKSLALSRLCLAWERDALHVYRQIRALEHARLSDQTVGNVLDRHPLRVPRRPPIGKPVASAKTPAEPPAREEASLDDVLGDKPAPEGGGASEADLAASVREDPPEIVAQRLAMAREIHTHIRRMVAAATNQLAMGLAPGSFVLGSLSVEDPEFGPWYGHEPLPRRADKVNVVPSGSGGEGPPFWPFVAHWRAVGPFRGAAAVNLHMPDVFPFSPGVLDVIPVGATLMSGATVKERHQTPDTCAWREKLMEPGSEMVRPWRMTARGHGPATGLSDATFYLATTLWSEEDTELWAGGRADDTCLLWVNERLVCRWPAPAATNWGENTALFKLKLSKGENRVVARLDNDEHWTGLSLRLCLRGKPRTAAAAREGMAAAQRGIARAVAADAGIFGWRRRCDGRFEDAKPPLAWDIKTGLNVRWRRPLGGGKSHPVIAGDKLLVTVDPISLVCLEKHTGAVLWEREMNILELADPVLFKESQALRQAWQDLSARAVKASAERQADAGAMHKEAADARRKWWEFVCKRGGIQKESMWSNYVGHMFAAPVTDGRHVWVKCAAGVAACYDLDGNRVWMTRTDYADNGFSFCSSPVLMDGKLIFELPAAPDSYWQSQVRMVCLDAATGKPLWEAPRVHNIQPSSSPLPVRLSNGSNTVSLVVTGGGILPVQRDGDLDDVFITGGTVVRADDGKVLIENLGVTSGWSSPVVLGDRLFHVDGRYGACTRLIMVNRDLVGAQRLWTRHTRDSDGGWVHHGGVLHGLPGGQFPHGFHFLDEVTGLPIGKPVNINTWYGKFGRAYTPPAYAGGYVFISDDGTVLASSTSGSKLFVMQPGRTGRLLARNILEPNMMPPLVFDGDRAYSRSNGSVICLGHTGEEGAAAEAEIVARTLMEDLPLEPPTAGEARAVPPIARPEAKVSEWGPVPVVHENWRLVGPHPAAEADAVLKAMGGPSLGKIGQEAIYNGQPLTHRVLDRSSAIKILSRTDRHYFNLAPTPAEQEGKVSHYYWLFETPRERTLRLLCDRADVDIWLSGVPVRNQDRVRTGAGCHALLVRYVAPAPLPRSTLMDLRLVDSPDAGADARFWRESIEANRAHLERVIALRPGSPTAEQAKALLGKL